jgi:NAD(P)-dependent dehydrogenase (short-subunit alcohol dehydrogenase family)
MDRPTIVITGASRGLGAETARAVAQLGANLVLAARSAGDLTDVAQNIMAQLFSKQIQSSETSVLAIPADVSHEGDCQTIIAQAMERFGRIDALVNNAGRIEPIARIAEADSGEWQASWAVNLLGPLVLTRLALPELRRNSGRVINVSSGTSTAVIQGWGAYSTAKAAIEHFTRILAAEEPGITAIVFRPGIVDTCMQATIRATGRTGMAESDYQRLSGLYEQGRMVPPHLPGRALATVALRAPHEWSGETVQWDEEKMKTI